METLIQLTQRSSRRGRIRNSFFGRKSLCLIVGCYGSILFGAAGLAQTCRYGCYYSNTYQGVDAMPYETRGGDNTALGYLTLSSIGTFYADTAVGGSALGPGPDSSLGGVNTAVGVIAMEYSDASGHALPASQNTAAGVAALTISSGASQNTAVGVYAIYYDYFDFLAAVSGFGNTAIGAYAISGLSGSIGSQATAIGASALPAAGALYNTADGYHALYTDNLGGNNLAEGNLALSNDTDGISNIAVGDSAGINLTTGDNNIDLGNKGIAAETKTIRLGKKGVQTATYIAGISGKTVANGVSVLIDTNSRLGTVNSSKRYKESIKLMANTSETILSLKPVTFRYKKKLDPQGIPQFGLVAEQVEKINADLVARDDEGKPFTVRYQAVNAMLLNEFAKEHRRVDERDAELNRLTSADSNQAMLLSAAEKEIAALKTTMKRQAAQIERMNVQLTAAPPPARLVTQR